MFITKAIKTLFLLPVLLLTGCENKVDLLVLSGNRKDFLRGTATGRLDGSGTMQLRGVDVECNGKFQYDNLDIPAYGSGDGSCSDGSTVDYRFKATSYSKGTGSGEDNEGRLFFFFLWLISS